MQRVPPSTQMQAALTAQFQAGHGGHPLRHFVARAVELMPAGPAAGSGYLMTEFHGVNMSTPWL